MATRKPAEILDATELGVRLGIDTTAAEALMTRNDFPATKVSDNPVVYVVESHLLTQWIRVNARRCPGINDGPFDPEGPCEPF